MTTPTLNSTARMTQWINSISAQQKTYAFVYGLAGVAQTLEVEPNMAGYVLDNLPGFALLVAAADILKAFLESYYAPKGEKSTANAVRHTQTLFTLLTSGYQGFCGYNSIQQLVTPAVISGSLTAVSLDFGFLIKSGWDLINSLIDFITLYKKYNLAIKANNEIKENDINSVIINDYNQAKKKLILNTISFLGFGLLTLSKTTVVATVTPLWLLLAGYGSLVLVGLVAMGYAFKHASEEKSPQVTKVSEESEQVPAALIPSNEAIQPSQDYRWLTDAFFSTRPGRAISNAVTATGDLFDKLLSDPTYGTQETDLCPYSELPVVTRSRR